jgi:hypothetical protein
MQRLDALLDIKTVRMGPSETQQYAIESCVSTYREWGWLLGITLTNARRYSFFRTREEVEKRAKVSGFIGRLIRY